MALIEVLEAFRTTNYRDGKWVSPDAEKRFDTLSSAWLTLEQYGNDELAQLERKLATDVARRDIECIAPARHGNVEYEGWHDTAPVDDPDIQRELAPSVRYLELRGLIRRHPDFPNRVQVLCEELED